MPASTLQDPGSDDARAHPEGHPVAAGRVPRRAAASRDSFTKRRIKHDNPILKKGMVGHSKYLVSS